MRRLLQPDCAHVQTCFLEHAAADAEVFLPPFWDRQPGRVDDLRDAGLDQRASAAGTGWPRDVSDAAFERHADARGVHDRVLLRVADERILAFAVLQPVERIFDASRKAVETRAADLAVRADHYAADLRGRVLAPLRDVPGQQQKTRVPVRHGGRCIARTARRRQDRAADCTCATLCDRDAGCILAAASDSLWCGAW